MHFKIRYRSTSYTLIRIVLLFSILFVVKSPNSFSEERSIINISGALSFSGFQKETIFLDGKSFSFFMLKPKAAQVSVFKKSSTILSFKPSLNILSKGHLTVNMLSLFLLKNNPALNPAYALRLATVYQEEASDEGVNPDIAFSQMCLETGFLKFGGDVLPGQNNFCGLGVTGHGIKGNSFIDMRSGVRAHIQHLKAYASRESLKNPLVDQRFNYVKRGSAINVDELKGKWATDKNYDKKIKSLLKEMYSAVKS